MHSFPITFEFLQRALPIKKLENRYGLSTPSPLLGQGFSLSSCAPWLHFSDSWDRIPSVSAVRSPTPPPSCLHLHKHLNIIAWKAASRDWDGEGRLGITASQPLLSAYSQEINDCRSQYHALSPFELDSYRFRFCGPPCLKQTILEWSTRTSELVCLGGSNPLPGWQFQRSSLI